MELMIESKASNFNQNLTITNLPQSFSQVLSAYCKDNTLECILYMLIDFKKTKVKAFDINQRNNTFKIKNDEEVLTIKLMKDGVNVVLSILSEKNETRYKIIYENEEIKAIPFSLFIYSDKTLKRFYENDKITIVIEEENKIITIKALLKDKAHEKTLYLDKETTFIKYLLSKHVSFPELFKIIARLLGHDTYSGLEIKQFTSSNLITGFAEIINGKVTEYSEYVNLGMKTCRIHFVNGEDMSKFSYNVYNKEEYREYQLFLRLLKEYETTINPIKR